RGPDPIDRCRPRYRLHPRGLHERRAAFRSHPRHRREAFLVRVQARPYPDRDVRDCRRTQRPLDPTHGWRPGSGHPVAVRPSEAAVLHREAAERGPDSPEGGPGGREDYNGYMTNDTTVENDGCDTI